MNNNILCCPVCRAALLYGDNNRSLSCEHGHSFDVSKSGYVNLTRGSAVPTAGDSPEMIRARRDFLSAGYYCGISDALNSVCRGLSHSTLIDAGCGEGYYTHRLAADLRDSTVYGFDLSKTGIDLAAREAKRENLSSRLTYAVAGIFDLPVLSESADIVVSLFAPCAGEEFSRVLRNGGHLVMGVAGRRHLYGLKSVIYDTPYENELRRDEIPGFEFETVSEVNYEITVPNKFLFPLFSMTPYYFRTSPADKAKLTDAEEVTTEVSVDILIYKKVG